MIAETPAPPYYAVIFTSLQTETLEGYSDMADQMEALAKQQEGYLGIESARNAVGITISYWKDEQSIMKWKQQADHLLAQQKGITNWYSHYHVRVCKVERAYDFRKL
jgi:heme-degrading monooxygenase HmoA